ncbi:MAG: N-acetylmuramoyl-L-alanine amidase [Clostridia bacterium]|nr:N-acetylmuramoyl-L-alanine amidase [Clostridia bacterium]
MKKYILFSVLTILFCLTSIVSYAADDESVSAIINREISIVYNNELKAFSDVKGTKVDPISYNYTTYLPIRAISALFNTPVEWDGENNKVLIGKGDIVTSTVKTVDSFEKGKNEEVNLTLSKSLVVEYQDKAQTFKDANEVIVYPLSYEGTTYLPVRAISNMYGASVDWNEENQRITLALENKVAKITDVIIKVVDDTLCTEIKTDGPIKDYTEYLMAEGVVTAEPYLNMRANSNTSAEIIETIPKDTTVSVKEVINAGRNSVWYKVTYGEKTGYVSSDYVKVGTAKLFIDLENSRFATSTASKDINYDNIKMIRFGDQGKNVNRIVLDLNNVTEYSVFQSDDKLTTYMALAKNFEIKTDEELKDYVLVASIGNQIFLPEIDKDTNLDSDKEPTLTPEIPSGEVVGEPSGDEVIEENSGDNVTSGDLVEDTKKDDELTDEQKEKMAKITAILYSSSTDKTKINISGNYDYEKFMLDNPTRLVIDIKNSLLEVDGPKEITPKNKNIEEIRFSQNEKDKVRVVFQLVNVADYEITEKSKGLEIEIAEPKYRNVEYIAYDDYAELILKNVKKRVFDTSETSKTNKLTITYSSSKFDSGKSTLEIDDDFVEKIDIRTNKITITGTGKMKYSSLEQDGSDVVITISKDNKKNDKGNKDGNFVVLVDAGHGGSDPGACNGKHYEKVYNLAIALKLQELLEDTEGITVYMSRDDDTYLDREDRVNFANSHDEADLFVSVHNNSIANKNYSGTMVLYYNKECEADFGITSKEVAELVLDELIDALGTKNLGVVSRPDLGVLYDTALPSILCEVAFMSNDEEVERIKTEKFQDAAAMAIYEGILAAKEQMGK